MKITTYLKKVNKNIFPLFIIFIIIYSLSLTGCKGFGAPDWELNVAIQDGIDGTPTAGSYTYKELETVEYNYYPIDDELTIEVLVNGSSWDLAGTFVMYNNINVVVTIFDIRGMWTITYKDDESEDEFDFVLEFTGDDLLSGNIIDDRGYVGSWEIIDSALTITYGNWENFVFSGSVPTMSGTYTNGSSTGTWSADRL